MKKQTYTQPLAEIFEVRLQANVLQTASPGDPGTAGNGGYTENPLDDLGD